MDSEKLLRDLKVFTLVTLFYLALFGVICAFKARQRRKNSSTPTGLKPLLQSVFANKNFVYLYSAVYLFTAMYAVKNVVIRIVFMFIYAGFIVKLVKNDLDSRKK